MDERGGREKDKLGTQVLILPIMERRSFDVNRKHNYMMNSGERERGGGEGDRQTGRQAGRQADKDRDRETETERNTQRELKVDSLMVKFWTFFSFLFSFLLVPA